MGSVVIGGERRCQRKAERQIAGLGPGGGALQPIGKWRRRVAGSAVRGAPMRDSSRWLTMRPSMGIMS
jgi:hypothetical protein